MPAPVPRVLRSRDSAGRRSPLAYESVMIGGLASEGDRLPQLLNQIGETISAPYCCLHRYRLAAQTEQSFQRSPVLITHP